jgi:hypothetical protein
MEVSTKNVLRVFFTSSWWSITVNFKQTELTVIRMLRRMMNVIKER